MQNISVSATILSPISSQWV